VLGFTAATFGFYGVHAAIWPLWFPGLVFLPFIADASITLIRRAVRRERLWQAHREHYYQRLILSGWNHARMATVAYALMLGCAAAALITLATTPRLGWPLLFASFAGLGLLMRLVDARWSRHVSTRASVL
jgi:phospho-N-acetylmuramoyl-pentapeptide-transferase